MCFACLVKRTKKLGRQSKEKVTCVGCTVHKRASMWTGRRRPSRARRRRQAGKDGMAAWHRMRTLVGIYRCSRPCLLPASARLGWGVSCNISSIFLFTSHATRKLLRKTREFHIDNKRIRKMTTKNVLTRRLNRKKKNAYKGGLHVGIRRRGRVCRLCPVFPHRSLRN